MMSGIAFGMSIGEFDSAGADIANCFGSSFSILIHSMNQIAGDPTPLIQHFQSMGD
jgi:hypothetical protein